MGFAREKGAAAVVLDTLDTMAAAQRLYTRLGFVQGQQTPLGKNSPRSIIGFRHSTAAGPSTKASARDAGAQQAGAAAADGADGAEPPQAQPRKHAHAKPSKKGKAPPPASSTSTSVAWPTGSAVRLTHMRTRATMVVVVEQEKGGAKGPMFKIARPAEPYKRLHVSQAGKVTWGGKGGRFATFAPVLVSATAGGNVDAGADAGGGGQVLVALRSMGNPTKTNRNGTQGWHLDIGEVKHGEKDLARAISVGSVLHDGDAADETAWFYAKVLEPTARFELVRTGGAGAGTAGTAATTATAARASTGAAAVAVEDLCRQFVEQGYAVAPGAVGGALVRRALIRINQGLGTPGAMVRGGVQPGTVSRCCSVPIPRPVSFARPPACCAQPKHFALPNCPPARPPAHSKLV